MKIYNVTEFAKKISVSVKTLQRWDREGKLKPLRTPSNRRIYTQEHLAYALQIAHHTSRRAVVYMRVADSTQKHDLVSQRLALEAFCTGRGLAVDEWITDIGGGLNYDRPKLLSLIDMIVAGDVHTLVIAHQDRLARFGFELIEHLCRLYSCDLVILNNESHSPNQELLQELQVIVHTYSARVPALKQYRDTLRRALGSPNGGD